MNGIISITDGVAILEDGDLNCDDINSSSLSANNITTTNNETAATTKQQRRLTTQKERDKFSKLSRGLSASASNPNRISGFTGHVSPT